MIQANSWGATEKKMSSHAIAYTMIEKYAASQIDRYAIAMAMSNFGRPKMLFAQ